MKTNKPNVLLLSAGRRVELIKAIKQELQLRGLRSMMFATDLKPEMSAACQLADQAVALSRVTAPGYMDQLLALCLEQKVGLVIPTIDTELLSLAEHREIFSAEGIELVISDESLVRVCRDKRLTAQLFNSVDIDVPKILDRQLLTFPCFAKPYDGSRSVGAAKLSQAADLSDGMRDDPKMMFMEFIDQSFEEYTVDAYYDRKGILKCLVPRHRLEVRDGEINKGVTRKHYVYEYLIDKLSKLKGARGCLTVQLFAHPHEKRYAALEINPRFGGGYPLSYSAGANYPGWLIDEYLLQKEINFFDEWTSDLMMLRYDAHVLVKMPIDIARTVVVFDLDDTLYPEADYVNSGVRYVCGQIKFLCGIDCYEVIQTQRLQNAKLDWLSLACKLTGLKPSVKESLLWMYRLHLPDINLSENCSVSLEKIKSAALAVAVLTDGRSVTQKLKLASLGISDWPAYVSEDYGSAKPAPDRFQTIQKDFPAAQYVYVADNVQKDFLGCNPLGWLGVGMRGNDRNIYSQSTLGLPESALPTYWVNNWDELTELLLNL